MTRAQRIRRRLEEVFSPEALEVEDESARHHGHAGWREGGESHYRVRIVAVVFAGLSRLQRHRMVHEVLSAELRSGLHALAIEAKAPGE